MHWHKCFIAGGVPAASEQYLFLDQRSDNWKVLTSHICVAPRRQRIYLNANNEGGVGKLQWLWQFEVSRGEMEVTLGWTGSQARGLRFSEAVQHRSLNLGGRRPSQ